MPLPYVLPLWPLFMNENGGCGIPIVPSATHLARYNLLQSSFIILERVISSANSPIHSSQNALLYMQASPKFALYLYQILDGFMGSYRPIKQWKVCIMWQHREEMTIWGVKVRKSDSHCSMLSVLLGIIRGLKCLTTCQNALECAKNVSV